MLYDLIVVGGGINGAAIARDAAGRGFSVLLVEQGDLGGATSSASSKLVHGGLRYLEHYEFRLVREALAEREVWLAAAPHLVRPLRFVLPHAPHLRPRWMIRIGLALYDHLGPRRRLPASRALDLAHDPAGRPLRREFRRGFAYADCWVDDARLVVLTARDAAERGATVLPRSACRRARRVEGAWEVELAGGRRERGRALVNAAGPWLGQVLADVVGEDAPLRLRRVQGSHIVVPRLHDRPDAYILQNRDRRIVFALPFEDDFTLVGTTDVPFTGDPAAAAPSAAEVEYLCATVNAHFRRPIGPADVVWRFAGVRALKDDASRDPAAVTRDYALETDEASGLAGTAPLLNVIGGKLTTCRRLAEAAMERLAPWLGERPCWTRDAVLPGGDIERGDVAGFGEELRRRHHWLSPAAALRLARAYGSRVERFLDGARQAADLGRDFGAGLSEAEVDHLRREEWARTADDVLWRRTKLGLRLTAAEREALAKYLGG